MQFILISFTKCYIVFSETQQSYQVNYNVLRKHQYLKEIDKTDITPKETFTFTVSVYMLVVFILTSRNILSSSNWITQFTHNFFSKT